MLFNSYPFVFVFLPLALAGFAVLARWRTRRSVLAFLIVASLAFYAWWDWRFLSLIVFSIVFNFSLGTRLQRRARQLGASAAPARRLLALGIGVNLGLLAYFKYRNFLVDTVSMAVGTEWALPPLVLPLAISFFTFEQITYLVDAYHGDTGDYDFLGYSLFISFFPHLIAGPIVRFKELVPQFSSTGHLRLLPRQRDERAVHLRHRAVQEGDDRGHLQPLGRRPSLTRRPRSGSRMRGGRRWPSRCSCTSTSPDTPTWPSAWRSC